MSEQAAAHQSMCCGLFLLAKKGKKWCALVRSLRGRTLDKGVLVINQNHSYINKT